MNLFFNISHPAHVHFFKRAIPKLQKKGHKIIVGARKKEFTYELLKAYGVDYRKMTLKGNGLVGLLVELMVQQVLLERIIRKHNIDMMLQIGGIFNAPIGWLRRIPTLAFSDTENDRWGNRVSFSLSRHVFTPSCYDPVAGGRWKNQIHYPGYHELAYLTPNQIPSREKEKKKFLIRFVGWGAGHDIGETSLSNKQKIALVHILQSHGEVFISSEGPLPKEISKLHVQFHPSTIHDFMKRCQIVVGESATMASEAACLGIPAIFISNTGRGYTTEQDERYDLVKHFRLDQFDAILATLRRWVAADMYDTWQAKRKKMLQDKIDVTAWLVELVDHYPQSIQTALHGAFEGYRF
jgi:predicted glycosyltransferase